MQRECATGKCSREAHPIYTDTFVDPESDGPWTTDELQRELAAGNVQEKPVCRQCHKWGQGVDVLHRYTVPATLLSFVGGVSLWGFKAALLVAATVPGLMFVAIPVAWKAYLDHTDPGNGWDKS